MKVANVIVVSVLTAGLALTISAVKSGKNNSQQTDNILLSCVTFPLCSGTDTFSPVSKPKDSKTETQDAKDEKVA